MKKIIFIIILLCCIVIGCEKQDEKEIKGIYISYIELSEHLCDRGETDSKREIDQMVQNVKELGANTIILHVRPSMDAIYSSKIFPVSKYIVPNDYDVLSYFIEQAHESHIQLIAWVNPYRILTQGSREDIPSDSPVYSKRNTRLVVEENGVFLNPAIEESTNLILAGIDEILEYPVDGILMDDYFYPGMDVDHVEYQEYLKTHDFISLQDYHLIVINNMVRRVHEHCEQKGVLFGVSPEGNIENNYQKNGADVKKWMKEDGYIDFIMPQLYYGFLNGSKPFVETFREWQMINERNVPLIPVLAFYKVGKMDAYAKDGKDEWVLQDNVIQKEIIHLKNQSHYQGFVLYRYDNIWNEEKYTSNSLQEINHLKSVIR